MTLWLIRAGSQGEHEQKFLDEGRVYVAWEGLDVDLGALADRQALIGVFEDRFPDEKAKAGFADFSSDGDEVDRRPCLAPLAEQPPLIEQLWLLLQKRVVNNRAARHCLRLLRNQITKAVTMRDLHENKC
jgi:hypothetical protein